MRRRTAFTSFATAGTLCRAGGLRLALMVGALLLSAVVFAGPGDSGETQLSDGRQIYLSACAACHGPDGRGAPQQRLGFDTPPPDFTDCNFATREADADWIAVAHEGGPVRGFSRFMPAFGKALSVAQLEAAVAHIRTFCGSSRWPRGELNLPRPLVTTKAYPEDEVVLSTFIDAEDSGRFEVEAIFEKRVGARNQVELVVPVGRQRADDSERWRSVLGDIALAYKRVVYDDLERGTILSLNAEALLPTGDEESGFSNDTVVFEPQLLYGQLLPLGFFLHGQAGFGLPADRDKANEEAFWRLAGGRALNQGRWGRRWSPMVELLGAHEFSSDADTQWDLVPQLQVTLNRRQHVRLALGARLPLTDTDTRNAQIGAYLLWDFFDGAFAAGW